MTNASHGSTPAKPTTTQPPAPKAPAAQPAKAPAEKPAGPGPVQPEGSAAPGEPGSAASDWDKAHEPDKAFAEKDKMEEAAKEADKAKK